MKPKPKSPRKKRSNYVRKYNKVNNKKSRRSNTSRRARRSNKKSSRFFRSKSIKNIDSGDFSDTGLYNITNNTILKLSRDKLLLKYVDLIEYLNIRKRQLEITGKSTVRVEMQLKAAKLEMKYLVDNFSTYSVGLRMLNKMP